MTKLCYAFLKYENKIEIGWEKECTVLKCTQMRARLEKVDVLGWNKSLSSVKIYALAGTTIPKWHQCFLSDQKSSASSGLVSTTL